MQKEGLEFKPGLGYYEFTKPESISRGKRILLMKTETGEVFDGDNARKIAKLPENADGKVNPATLLGYRVFVQSTSSNRTLQSGTALLYDTKTGSAGNAKALADNMIKKRAAKVPGETRTFVKITIPILRAYLAKNNFLLDSLIPEQYHGRLEQDLSVVIIADENVGWGDDNAGCCSGLYKLVGFHTLPNGLTFLGIESSGDWEFPVFLIVYWDGNDLRGYVPKKGNVWNKTTNRAYGNDHTSDEEDLNEQAAKIHVKITHEEEDEERKLINDDMIQQDILEHFPSGDEPKPIDAKFISRFNPDTRVAIDTVARERLLELMLKYKEPFDATGFKKLLEGFDLKDEFLNQSDLKVALLRIEVDIPSQILTHLAKDDDANVRRAVAEHEQAPPEILAVLAKDEDYHVRGAVASNEGTPPETLTHLAGDAEDWVRYAVARHMNTTPETLARLAMDTETTVRRVVAQNQRKQSKALAHLAYDQDVLVRWYVAMNPDTPSDALIHLASDPMDMVRSMVNSNINKPAEASTRPVIMQDASTRERAADDERTPANTLAILARDKAMDVRRKVAMNPNAPLEALERLAGDKDSDVRVKVASNKNTPADVLTHLARDEKRYVRIAVAGNENTNLETLKQLIGEKINIEMLKALASNPNTDPINDEELIMERKSFLARNEKTPPDVLVTLSGDKDKYIRTIVANNTNTPPETLARLAEDEDPDVRKFVSSNPKTPIEVLARLPNDKYAYVLINLAWNPNTPSEALTRIAKEERVPNYLVSELREAIAHNHNTSSEILVRLVNDRAFSVREMLALNPNTPVDSLEILARELRIREILAVHPSTPKEFLARLVDDEAPSVRCSLAENPSTPDEIFVRLLNDKDGAVRAIANKVKRR